MTVELSREQLMTVEIVPDHTEQLLQALSDERGWGETWDDAIASVKDLRARYQAMRTARKAAEDELERDASAHLKTAAFWERDKAELAKLRDLLKERQSQPLRADEFDAGLLADLDEWSTEAMESITDGRVPPLAVFLLGQIRGAVRAHRRLANSAGEP